VTDTVAVLPTPIPRAIGHVGITVPDLDAAVAWYGAVFGMRLIRPVVEIGRALGGPFEAMLADIFGPGFRRSRTAFLSSANGCVIEAFEFPDAGCAALDDDFDHRRRGLWHLGFIDPDVERLAARIVKHGGRRRSRVWDLVEGKPYRFCYCQDPWGTVIEVLSHSTEQMFANLD
jgi:catechol 2,3-dioxygenase-like lactoylglutathione lyase family enzyme